MKHWLLLLIVCQLSFFSCGSNADAIRENAIKYESLTALNGIIELYSECYYKMPETVDNITSFIDEWRQNDSASYLYSRKESADIAEALSSHSIDAVFYDDSVFLFDRKNKLGCCVYGTPKYWLEHPERWPSERNDYWYQFKTAAFDREGEYIFNLDYERINEDLVTVGDPYRRICMTSYYTQSLLTDNLVLQKVPYQIAISYDADEDNMETLAAMPTTNEIFCFDRDSDGQDESFQFELSSNLQDQFSEYFSDMGQYLKSLVNSDERIAKIIFCSSLFSEREQE